MSSNLKVVFDKIAKNAYKKICEKIDVTPIRSPGTPLRHFIRQIHDMRFAQCVSLRKESPDAPNDDPSLETL